MRIYDTLPLPDSVVDICEYNIELLTKAIEYEKSINEFNFYQPSVKQDIAIGGVAFWKRVLGQVS